MRTARPWVDATAQEPRFLPSGDTALVVEFGDRIDRRLSAAVTGLADRIRVADLGGVTEAEARQGCSARDGFLAPRAGPDCKSGGQCRRNRLTTARQWSFSGHLAFGRSELPPGGKWDLYGRCRGANPGGGVMVFYAVSAELLPRGLAFVFDNFKFCEAGSRFECGHSSGSPSQNPCKPVAGYS